jgi:hypothetical protein
LNGSFQQHKVFLSSFIVQSSSTYHTLYAMTAYLQKFFFGSQGTNQSRTHNRSEPTNYIYAPSVCCSTSSAVPPFSTRSCGNHYPTMLPPLRSATHNTNSARAQGLGYQRQKPECPVIYHRGTHKTLSYSVSLFPSLSLAECLLYQSHRVVF